MNAELPTNSRQEFGAVQTMQTEGAASSALMVEARAAVEARYIMAMRNRRNWDSVRQDILRECKRPMFANNKSALYLKPVGNNTVEGLGIRFAEVALRCMTNIDTAVKLIYADDEKEVHRATVTDLESNTHYTADITVLRTVERSKPLADGSYISVRINSVNKPAYTVPATEDDMMSKRAAQISKTLRELTKRHVPGDIQDEAIAIIKQIRLNDAAKDPAGERKRIADAFDGIGVKVADLIAYLGHPLDSCSPSEMVKLRGIYGAIRDGETTWASVIDNEDDNRPEAPPPATVKAENKAEKQPPTCSAESFEKKKGGWKSIIESGKKSVNDLIATIQTKELLTEDQKIEIASWMPTTTGEQQ